VTVDNTVHLFLSGAGFVLPNLNDLRICLVDFADSAIYPCLVIGPALRSLSIKHDAFDDLHETPSAPQMLWSNLAMALSQSVQLHSFALETEVDEDHDISLDGIKVLLPHYCKLENLKRIAVLPSTVDLHFLSHFSSSPILEYLHMSVHSNTLSEFILAHPPAPLFNNVASLLIRTEKLSAAQELICCNGLESLEVLHIIRMNAEITWNLPSFLRSLWQHKSSMPLEELYIHDNRVSVASKSALAHPITLATITHLFVFSQITVVSIDLNQSTSLDDHVLDAIADAWPHLQQLTLYDWSDPSPDRVKTTLSGLSHLSRCLELEDLALRINAMLPTAHAVFAHGTTSTNKLQEFCVCRSPAENPTALAQLLRTLFPNLKDMSYGYDRHHYLFASESRMEDDEVPYLETWRDVWRQLNNGQ
jgi:hypothetical protein